MCLKRSKECERQPQALHTALESLDCEYLDVIRSTKRHLGRSLPSSFKKKKKKKNIDTFVLLINLHMLLSCRSMFFYSFFQAIQSCFRVHTYVLAGAPARKPEWIYGRRKDRGLYLGRYDLDVYWHPDLFRLLVCPRSG